MCAGVLARIQVNNDAQRLKDITRDERDEDTRAHEDNETGHVHVRGRMPSY